MKAPRLLLALFVVAIGGCRAYNAPVMPPRGMLLTQFTAPITTDFGDTPVGKVKGQASAHYLWTVLFPSIAWGEAGIEEAARSQNIKTVYYAEYSYLEVLGLYARMTVKVYGE